MDEVCPRHRFGNFVLIFALLAVVFAGFSKGSVWAQSESQLNTTIEDDFGDPVTINATIESELKLREMDVAIEGSTEFVDFFGSGQSVLDYSETETYEQLAQNSAANVSDTFESIDTAGMVAGWMIRLGIIATVVTAILSLCSLTQVLSSRPVLVAGGVSTGFLLLTPVIWFILLPSNGTYANDIVLGGSVIWFEEPPLVPIDFSPSPSTGLFLSVLSGLCSTTMMVMAVLHHRSEEVNHKPSWMIADDSLVLPEATLLNLFTRDGDSIQVNFSELKAQPKRLIMPGIHLLLIILFFFALSGVWASYTIDLSGEGIGMKMELSFTEEGVLGSTSDDGSALIPYDGSMDSSWKEMGEVIAQSVTLGTIAIWMLILSLAWRFAVSTGGAQKLPALCQHHRIIDTLLLTGGSILAFGTILYFVIQSPSDSEIFGLDSDDLPEELVGGGTSLYHLALMVIFFLYALAVLTLGEHGAPLRRLLSGFGIPMFEEQTFVDPKSKPAQVSTLLANPFQNPRISGLPWVTIGIVILVLFALGGGGFLAMKMTSNAGESSDSNAKKLYDSGHTEMSLGVAESDTIYMTNGAVESWDFELGPAPEGMALAGFVIIFDYDETDPDPFCDTMDVTLSISGPMFDSQNSSTQGSVDDCSEIQLELYIERYWELQSISGSSFLLTEAEVQSLQAYYNEHEGGEGMWEFAIYFEDVGGPIENGEEVSITVEPRYISLDLEEVAG